MKYLIFTTLIFSNILYANYSFNNQNSKNIDMHGGKGDKLIDSKSSFSNKNMNSLSIGINKPKKPNAPKPLISQDKTKPTKKTNQDK